MGVRNLARGKDQPFYSCFCMDGTVRCRHLLLLKHNPNTSYSSVFCLDVAEDNIQPLDNCGRDVFEKLKDKIYYLPRYFTGVVMNEEWSGFSRGRFALSPETQKAYPEDDDIGQAWVELPPAMSQVK
jgi:F-box protein 21